MMVMKKILFTLLEVLALTGCNAQTTKTNEQMVNEQIYPQVMFTFFDTYDLNGKTIYPFTTHEGSGLGNVMSDIRKAYPNADVKPGFSIYGHEVRTNKAKVEKWIKGLGL